MSVPMTRERFASLIDTNGDCHEWTGYRDDRGYGHTGFRGRRIMAHRLAWLLAHGPISDGLHVLHHCDNPPCVRLDHLYLGTHADNMRDAASRGRIAYPSRGDPIVIYQERRTVLDLIDRGSGLLVVAEDEAGLRVERYADRLTWDDDARAWRAVG